MKRILSTVLALCLILGCVAVGFTAQAASAEAALQAGINAAIANGTDYTWTGKSVNLTKPLTINGDVKVDFKGATIKGAPHQFAIVIDRGNVELFNADIEGIDAAYSSASGFVDEVNKARPTINIGNANVTLSNIVVTGAYVTVYGTGEEIPLSDAVSVWGANGIVNLNNVRAFGNTGVDNKRGSKVNVTECIVGGYYADFGDDSNVSFANGTNQYTGMDFIVDALSDQVTLTEGEERYMTRFFANFLQVTTSVKAQADVDPVYDYDADADTLKVTVKADKSYGDTKYKCAFDYLYIPKTATIGEDTQNFVKTGDLTYTATFENIPAATVCDTDFTYKLAFDLGSDAQALIDNAYEMLEGVIYSIPAMLIEADGTLRSAIAQYLNGDQGIATILWNLYNTEGALEAMLSDLPEDKQDKAKADVKAMLGPIFDICGIELRAGNNTDSPLYKAIKAVREGTANTNQLTQVRGMVLNTNASYGSHLNADENAGKDLGKGLIGTFLDYWKDILDLAVTADGEFNDIKGLGEYLGANYEEMYNDFLKTDVKTCLNSVNALLADEDNYVIGLLADNNISLNGISDITSLMETLISFADSVFASKTYQEIVRIFGDRVPTYCGIYLEKAFNIATNADVYFDFETDGRYVEFFEYAQEASYTTPNEEEMVKVTVNVYGYGKYAVNGDTETTYTTKQIFEVPKGGNISVDPVEYGAETLFNYFAISDANGNDRLSADGGDLTVYSDTILSLYFAIDAETIEIVFMTNYELSAQYLDTLVKGEIEELPEVPEFKGATFLGWATENVSGAAAQQADILITKDSDVIALANAANHTMTFYAIYKFDEITVDSELLNKNTLVMSDCFVSDHRAYFTALFSDRTLAEGDVIVEAGILAAGNEGTINDATPSGGNGIVKGTLNLDLYRLPAFYTFAIHFNNHSTDRTAYAKGFVTIQHSDGTFTTEYTAVQSQVIAAY